MPGSLQAGRLTAITCNLLEQGHPLRVYVPPAADDAVQVDAAGHSCTVGVSAVPDHLIAPYGMPDVMPYRLCYSNFRRERRLLQYSNIHENEFTSMCQ